MSTSVDGPTAPQDIAQLTARIAALEQQVQRDADQYQFVHDFLGSLPSMLCYCSGESIDELRYGFANDAYLSMSPDRKIVGRRVRDVLGEALFAKNQPVFSGVLRGEPQQGERSITDAVTGHVRHIRVNYVPHRRGKKVVGFINWLSSNLPRILPDVLMMKIKKQIASPYKK